MDNSWKKKHFFILYYDDLFCVTSLYRNLIWQPRVWTFGLTTFGILCRCSFCEFCFYPCRTFSPQISHTYVEHMVPRCVCVNRKCYEWSAVVLVIPKVVLLSPVFSRHSLPAGVHVWCLRSYSYSVVGNTGGNI